MRHLSPTPNAIRFHLSVCRWAGAAASDAAVTDLEALEAELLRLASHYLDRPAPPDLRRADVDRWAVLEDVYECDLGGRIHI